jgi:hypothetical protein
MDSVWFQGGSEKARQRQGWFVHVGRGDSIRNAGLPLPYTKRMAHHFMAAPDDLSVDGALRWGQIHAVGGSSRLARAVIGTRLGSHFEEEDFWSTVISWLASHPMLDPTHVGPIVDYLQHQKFVPQDCLVAPNRVERRGPPQPNLTMKGRTPASLLKQVEDWHRKLARTVQPTADWPPCGVRSFEFVEGSEQSGNLKVWTIVELLSTKALVAEGRTMKHCVATYARSCAAGACSIWTLEVKSVNERRKILTIEVNNRTKVICQARGKCNAFPSDKHRAILRRWADEAGLQVANRV